MKLKYVNYPGQWGHYFRKEMLNKIYKFDIQLNYTGGAAETSGQLSQSLGKKIHLYPWIEGEVKTEICFVVISYEIKCSR